VKKQCLRFALGILLFLWADAALSQGNAAHDFMVVAANPKAVEAGYQVLKEGGNALDAAVAVQMVLSLVEPQSSGIGGGAFLLYWDNQSKKLHAYDGRETAPNQAKAERFLLPDGKAQKFYQAVVGGLSVGVPGVLGMLEKAHVNHGRAPWTKLFLPGIKLAEEGVTVSPRLMGMLKKDRYLKDSPTARDYFYNPDGTPKNRLLNPALSQTLKQVAQGGSRRFYEGHLAKTIVDAVKNARPAGDLSLLDMKDYKAMEREPLCGKYRSYTVCSMPPPTSGGIAILQLLGMLETFDVKDKLPESLDMIHLFTQAQRLAFADRNHYVADSDFVPVPMRAMLDKKYLRGRAKGISLSRDMGRASPGNPLGQVSETVEEGEDFSLPSTSHISIIDGWGNAVSMTSSVENSFGSRLFTGGFLLNNQLTDFSFVPARKGRLVANRVEPGKRPRSSMTPIMVFDAEGNLRIVAGSPGGSRIIGYVARTVWRLMEWNHDPQAVVGAPNFGNRNGVTELEAGSRLEALKAPLESLGHQVKIRPMNSGLNVIALKQKHIYGGTDPRREGIIMIGGGVDEGGLAR
jgi:gamma-glutamyltranspeptidase / glutathione hydrolase